MNLYGVFHCSRAVHPGDDRGAVAAAAHHGDQRRRPRGRARPGGVLSGEGGRGRAHPRARQEPRPLRDHREQRGDRDHEHARGATDGRRTKSSRRRCCATTRSAGSASRATSLRWSRSSLLGLELDHRPDLSRERRVQCQPLRLQPLTKSSSPSESASTSSSSASTVRRDRNAFDGATARAMEAGDRRVRGRRLAAVRHHHRLRHRVLRGTGPHRGGIERHGCRAEARRLRDHGDAADEAE